MNKIKKEDYLKLKEKFSDVASFALWVEPREGKGILKKDRLSDMSVLTDESILEKFNPNYVFVALNEASYDGAEEEKDSNGFAKKNPAPWGNFHCEHRVTKDSFLREALMNSRYEGSYITDIAKYHPETDSFKVKAEVLTDSEMMEENFTLFRQELDLISKDSKKPVIIAIGGAVYEKMVKEFGEEYDLIKITHYSARGTGTVKEYGEQIREDIKRQLEVIKSGK